MNKTGRQEYPVVFHTLKILVCMTLAMLYAGTAMGQARVGDWEFQSESEGSAVKGRVASTTAQTYSGGEPKPTLVIRRSGPGSPIELLVTATHDREKVQCDYSAWKITIDATNVPVLGYSVEAATTELKARWGTPVSELWNLFRTGLKLAVQFEQKCGSFSEGSNLVNHTFSLRGSSAAYKFVLGSVE